MMNIRSRVNTTLFGERVRSLRRKRKLTQGTLSRELHVSSDTICKWEHGHCLPSLDMIGDIALYFDCNIEWLLGMACEDHKRRCLEMNEEIDKIMMWCQAMLRDKDSSYGIYTKLTGERREGFELALRAVMSQLYGMRKTEKVKLGEVENGK